MKELRFTRARQAAVFAVASVISAALAGGWFVLGWRWSDPGMPEPVLSARWPGAVPLGAGVLCGWVAFRLVRQPLVAVTPIGIEVYPLFRPARDSRLILWAEVASLECEPASRWFKITLSGSGANVIFISLEPLTVRSRRLLARMCEGMTANLDAARS